MSSFGPVRHAEPVLLNIYDLHPANDTLVMVGLGSYHSGVVVHGTEYTFGSSGGVFNHSPGDAGAPLRSTVQLGSVKLTSREVQSIVARLGSRFPGTAYNLLTCNCNTFSAALADELRVAPPPGWVNRMGGIGSMFACCLPRSMTQAAPVDDDGQGHAHPTAAAPAFSGEGRSLLGSHAGSSSAQPASAVERRAAAARAAAARQQQAAAAAALQGTPT